MTLGTRPCVPPGRGGDLRPQRRQRVPLCVSPRAGGGDTSRTEGRLDEPLPDLSHVLPGKALGQIRVPAADGFKDGPVLREGLLRAAFDGGGAVFEESRNLDESLQGVDELFVV